MSHQPVETDRAEHKCLVAAIQAATEVSIEPAYADYAHTGEKPAEAAWTLGAFWRLPD
ncbi:hypothetical protein [Komagataeibacter medellinensis]|uniref:Uncharacterized protein n=1 Tax=Komagataeibacter medellinensis (strain NBRC 3288 / BCRC 11682 / LMG 1693 / Kondo 51) TaxID=634177 RepID=G2I6Y0_KOMMN|nr:hypothetical protein [Komagataeibacter medellinensis]BAK83877.1 hypothetical protein GLX_14650 [Komagataeibacter medellinensis NBRC 3288]